MKKSLPLILMKNAIKLLIFMILIFPTVFQIQKLAIIVFIAFLYFLISVEKITVNYRVLIWGFSYIITNAIFLLLGSAKNPEIFRVLAPIHLIWPLLYFLVFIFPFSLKEIMFDLFSFFPKIGLVLSLLTIYIYLSYTGRVPVINELSVLIPHNINSFGGYVSYFSPNITSFFCLIPISISYVLFSKEKNLFALNFISLISMTLCSLLIGRRALLVTTGIIFILALLYKILVSKIGVRKIFKYCFLLIVISLFMYYVINVFNLNLRLFNFDIIADISDTERKLQFVDLIDSWKKFPIFGVGFGINSAHVIRSFTVPGLYELSYVALLFQTGIIGFTIYFFLYGWLGLRLFKQFYLTQNIQYLAIFLSYISIMIAHGTNPYITSFDGMWIIFFVLGYINKYSSTISERGEHF